MAVRRGAAYAANTGATRTHKPLPTPCYLSARALRFCWPWLPPLPACLPPPSTFPTCLPALLATLWWAVDELSRCLDYSVACILLHARLTHFGTHLPSDGRCAAFWFNSMEQCCLFMPFTTVVSLLVCVFSVLCRSDSPRGTRCYALPLPFAGWLPSSFCNFAVSPRRDWNSVL